MRHLIEKVVFSLKQLEKNFVKLVGFPTHIHDNTLDLVLSNQPENIITLEPIGNLSTSHDHSIILVRPFSTQGLTVPRR